MGRRGRVMVDGALAGWIEESEEGMTFQYDQAWLDNPRSAPVSLTLPLRRELYESRGPIPFFVGLLPEGWLFDIAIAKLKIARDDTFGLLLALCRDCPGAVSIEPLAPPESGE